MWKLENDQLEDDGLITKDLLPKGYGLTSYENLLSDSSWMKLVGQDRVQFDCGYIEKGKIRYLDGFNENAKRYVYLNIQF